DAIADKPEAVKQWRREHRWHPYQLRHNAATNLRKQFGLDVAATMLGHVRCDVTQVYAEKNHELAMQIAGKVG
ncbi:MAG: tyrosine-type recombinase/integrase, partial [Phycisphaerales bacterium]|nr:tyrosine-type recombinase/integrase [Phycisphaerales bacterium]